MDMNIVKEGFGRIVAFLPNCSVQTGADDDLVVTEADMKVGAYTVVAQPTSPSKIGIKVTATGDADTMGTITVVGTNIANKTITNVVVPVAGSTVYTTEYFKTVTSITGAGWVTAGGADKIKVGILATGGIEARGQSCTFSVLVGTVYINPDATATTANGIKLVAGQALDLVSVDVISYISNGNAATIQVLLWDS